MHRHSSTHVDASTHHSTYRVYIPQQLATKKSADPLGQAVRFDPANIARCLITMADSDGRPTLVTAERYSLLTSEIAATAFRRLFRSRLHCH
jgi:hypothetical protein